jgi:hypothetical protein
MPYCPNGGRQVKREHHYCGRCGFAQTDVVGESERHIPPSGTAAGRDGFLSGRSIQYLTDVLDGERELDPDTVG